MDMFSFSLACRYREFLFNNHKKEKKMNNTLPYTVIVNGTTQFCRGGKVLPLYRGSYIQSITGSGKTLGYTWVDKSGERKFSSSQISTVKAHGKTWETKKTACGHYYVRIAGKSWYRTWKTFIVKPWYSWVLHQNKPTVCYHGNA